MDFPFQYVSGEELKRVIKQVERRRRKEHEEEEWSNYLSSHGTDHNVYPSSVTDATESKSNLQKMIWQSETQDQQRIYLEKFAAYPPAIQEHTNLSAGPSRGNTQTSPATETRLSNCRKKMEATLDKILELINKVPVPDGIEDLARRRHRAVEFNSRFCRNYLYQLRRHVCELNKYCKMASQLPGQFNVTYQNLLPSFQIALRGLQAYFHHMPSSVAVGLPEKLKELLSYLCDLETIYSKCNFIPTINKSEPLHVLEKCRDLMRQIDVGTRNGDGDAATLSQAFSPSVSKIVQTRKKSATHSKLSMYKVKCPWKKMSALLAREKFGIPKKVPAQRPSAKPVKGGGAKVQPDASQNVCAPGSCKRPKGVASVAMTSRSKRPHEVNHGDHLQTMMELIPPDNLKESSSNLPHLSDSNLPETDLTTYKGEMMAVRPSIDHGGLESPPGRQGPGEIPGHTSRGKGRALGCVVGQATTMYISTKDSARNAKLIILPPYESKDYLSCNSTYRKRHVRQSSGKLKVTTNFDSARPERPSREPKLQAICFEQESSTKSSQLLLCAASREDVSSAVRDRFGGSRSVLSNRTLTLDNVKRSDDSPDEETQRQINLDEKKAKPLRVLKVSNEEVASARRYKKKFLRYQKRSGKYDETKKPWVVIETLADTLLDNALQEVVNELQVDNLIKSLYDFEFK